MRTVFVLSISLILTFAPLLHAQGGTGGKVPVPPLSNGGVAGLWFREHEFIEKEYGPVELLNFANTTYRVQSKGITDKSWQLVAMGNFLKEGIQYATLAQPKNENLKENILLIMFEWVEPSDTTKPHGVFYHSILSKDKLLIRTKQSGTGKIDTLEFSCPDVERKCGMLYLDSKSNEIVLKITDKK